MPSKQICNDVEIFFENLNQKPSLNGFCKCVWLLILFAYSDILNFEKTSLLERSFFEKE